VVLRIIEEDGLAVGETKKKGDSGRARHEAVGVGLEVASIGAGDRCHPAAMYLAGTGDTHPPRAEVGVDSRVVLGERGLIVTYVAADVQRGKGTAANAA
jgi:hypothetical protein